MAVFGLIGTISAGSILGMIAPLYYKKFFDALSFGVSSPDVRLTLLSVLGMVAILRAGEWVLWRLGGLANNYYQPRVVADLANFCFNYLHKHSFAFFNSNFVGSLVRRVNKFTGSFERIADRIIWSMLPLVVDMTAVLIILSRRHIVLGSIILVWIVFFMVINYFMTSFKLKYDLERSSAETEATAVLADTITNNANVKLFNGFKRERNLYAKVNERVRRLRKLTWDLDVGFEAIQTFLMFALEIGILYFAIGLWQKGILTIGDFVLIQAYLLTLFLRVWDVGKMIRHTYEDLAEAEDMTEVLNTPHEIQDIPNAQLLKVSQGRVVFKEVDFYYHETRPIITGLNLTIKPRERLAIIGPSGAGKTTLVKMMLRMHDITAGKIFIDDKEIRKITQESLWQSISLVPQEPMLFHRTLMENIRYGKPEATDKEVVKAAQLAHCHEFITEFPEKYNTYVGERGVKLSGGERQRVAIARAILRNSPILVLDEATSSLDSESERLIQAALKNLMKNKTVIVIAHRLSTIMKMDRIIVLDHGRIIEEGSHKELLQKRSGLYKQLWQLQAGGFIEK